MTIDSLNLLLTPSGPAHRDSTILGGAVQRLEQTLSMNASAENQIVLARTRSQLQRHRAGSWRKGTDRVDATADKASPSAEALSKACARGAWRRAGVAVTSACRIIKEDEVTADRKRVYSLPAGSACPMAKERRPTPPQNPDGPTGTHRSKTARAARLAQVLPASASGASADNPATDMEYRERRPSRSGLELWKQAQAADTTKHELQRAGTVKFSVAARVHYADARDESSDASFGSKDGGCWPNSSARPASSSEASEKSSEVTEILGAIRGLKDEVDSLRGLVMAQQTPMSLAPAPPSRGALTPLGGSRYEVLEPIEGSPMVSPSKQRRDERRLDGEALTQADALAQEVVEKAAEARAAERAAERAAGAKGVVAVVAPP